MLVLFGLEQDLCYPRKREHPRLIKKPFEHQVSMIMFGLSSSRSVVTCDYAIHETDIRQGRPLRVRMNAYIKNWEENRASEIKELTAKGVIPVEHDFETLGDEIDDDTMDNARPFLMGKAAAVVNEKKSAKDIVDEMVTDAVSWLQKGNKMIATQSKL